MDFSKEYRREDFLKFLRNDFLGDHFSQEIEETTILRSEPQSSFERVTKLGTCESLKGIIVLEIALKKKSDARITLTKELFMLLKRYEFSSEIRRNALVILLDPDRQHYRFSLLTSSFDENYKERFSDPKRFSFLLGRDEKVKTARDSLIKKGIVKDFEDLLNVRFNVEVVRKDFFNKYITLFVKLYVEITKDLDFSAMLTGQGIDLVTFAKNLMGKIVFLYFLQKKGWLGVPLDGAYGKDGDKDFMRHLWEDFSNRGESLTNEKTGNFYNDYLQRIFYDGLNKKRANDYFEDLGMRIPYLNGGLFKEDYAGWRQYKAKIANETFSNGQDGIFDIFDIYNFTIDEDDLYDKEIAVDPEMLGKIFENMISISSENIAEIVSEYEENLKKSKEKKLEIDNLINKKFGAFYTPREIVHYMTKESLVSFLANTGITSEKLIRTFFEIKHPYFDEAEIHKGYEELNEAGKAKLHDVVAQLDAKLAGIKVLDPAVGSGAFPMGILLEIAELRYFFRKYGFISGTIPLAKLKRDTIGNCIHGVDISPGAIDIAKLRFWLSIVVDEDTPHPLPNLEFKFTCANTLLPLEKDAEQTQLALGGVAQLDPSHLRSLMDAYYTPRDEAGKSSLKQAIIDYIDAAASAHDAHRIKSKRTRQLESFKPFDTSATADFFDPTLMLGQQDFDIVIGNPPYIQLQQFKKTPELQKAYKDAGYKVHDSNGDIYCLFYERGLSLAKPGTGLLCYITSQQWMRAGYGEKLRAFLADHDPTVLIDCGPGIFESATVNVNIILIRRQLTQETRMRALKLLKEERQDIAGALDRRSVTLRELSSAPWFIGTEAEIQLKKKIERIGKPLKDWDIKINRGILTGLDKAFIIDRPTRDRLIQEDPRSSEIIKPILKGRNIRRYGYEFGEQYLLQTGYDLDVKKLYPAIFNHLLDYEFDCKKRQDQGKNWWNLRACVYYDEFEKEKIVWGNISYDSRFTFVEGGAYVNAPANIITTKELSTNFLLAIMNSKIFDWEFKQIGIPLSEAYEWKKQYVELVHLPCIDYRNGNGIRIIEMLVEKIRNEKGDGNDYEELIEALVGKMYGLSYEEVLVYHPKFQISAVQYGKIEISGIEASSIDTSRKYSIFEAIFNTRQDWKSLLEVVEERRAELEKVGLGVPGEEILREIWEMHPHTRDELASVKGFSERYCEIVGNEILKVLNG